MCTWGSLTTRISSFHVINHHRALVIALSGDNEKHNSEKEVKTKSERNWISCRRRKFRCSQKSICFRLPPSLCINRRIQLFKALSHSLIESICFLLKRHLAFEIHNRWFTDNDLVSLLNDDEGKVALSHRWTRISLVILFSFMFFSKQRSARLSTVWWLLVGYF